MSWSLSFLGQTLFDRFNFVSKHLLGHVNEGQGIIMRYKRLHAIQVKETNSNAHYDISRHVK